MVGQTAKRAAATAATAQQLANAPEGFEGLSPEDQQSFISGAGQEGLDVDDYLGSIGVDLNAPVPIQQGLDPDVFEIGDLPGGGTFTFEGDQALPQEPLAGGVSFSPEELSTVRTEAQPRAIGAKDTTSAFLPGATEATGRAAGVLSGEQLPDVSKNILTARKGHDRLAKLRGESSPLHGLNDLQAVDYTGAYGKEFKQNGGAALVTGRQRITAQIDQLQAASSDMQRYQQDQKVEFQKNLKRLGFSELDLQRGAGRVPGRKSPRKAKGSFKNRQNAIAYSQNYAAEAQRSLDQSNQMRKQMAELKKQRVGATQEIEGRQLAARKAAEQNVKVGDAKRYQSGLKLATAGQAAKVATLKRQAPPSDAKPEVQEDYAQNLEFAQQDADYAQSQERTQQVLTNWAIPVSSEMNAAGNRLKKMGDSLRTLEGDSLTEATEKRDQFALDYQKAFDKYLYDNTIAKGWGTIRYGQLINQLQVAAPRPVEVEKPKEDKPILGPAAETAGNFAVNAAKNLDKGASKAVHAAVERFSDPSFITPSGQLRRSPLDIDLTNEEVKDMVSAVSKTIGDLGHSASAEMRAFIDNIKDPDTPIFSREKFGK